MKLGMSVYLRKSITATSDLPLFRVMNTLPFCRTRKLPVGTVKQYLYPSSLWYHSRGFSPSIVDTSIASWEYTRHPSEVSSKVVTRPCECIAYCTHPTLSQHLLEK